MKRKTQIAAITLAVAATTLVVWSDRKEDHSPGIEGVWQVARVGVNCSAPDQALGVPFPAIMTFHRDGAVSGGAKSPVTGPFDTPEQGYWQRERGHRNYSFRALQNRYDGSGVFLGPLILTADVELTGANSFAYSATIEIGGVNGEIIDTRCGRGAGTRFE